uniref:Uncharacterized protein n=1 Tax=Romanomermis culicivorax TaxID=13658 RepID=A0A915KTB7_ROMCU
MAKHLAPVPPPLDMVVDKEQVLRVSSAAPKLAVNAEFRLLGVYLPRFKSRGEVKILVRTRHILKTVTEQITFTHHWNQRFFAILRIIQGYIWEKISKLADSSLEDYGRR